MNISFIRAILLLEMSNYTVVIYVLSFFTEINSCLESLFTHAMWCFAVFGSLVSILQVPEMKRSMTVVNLKKSVKTGHVNVRSNK